jgi:CRISPR-associated protein Cmr1
VWWHTVKGPTIQTLREAEGDLFGWAADTEKKAKKSQVLLRLESWRQGNQTDQDFNKIQFPDVKHLELKDREGRPKPVAASLYLGYGPINPERGAAVLKRARALAAGENQTLTVAFPSGAEGILENAMQLISLFGTLGGRSRNGWGSLNLVPEESASAQWPPVDGFFDPKALQAREWLKKFSEDYQTTFMYDWCHSIGKDGEGLLLWCTEARDRWEEVFRDLAEAKIAFRTQFHFQGGGTHLKLCDRQILAYPVTSHFLSAWGQTSRLANQILFKVLADGDQHRGLVVHMPHGLPKPLREKLDPNTKNTLKEREIKVWSEVHQTLGRHFVRLP